jgi:hypothetical protein
MNDDNGAVWLRSTLHMIAEDHKLDHWTKEMKTARRR